MHPTLAVALLASLAFGHVPAAHTARASVWRPASGVSWQWQLQGRLDTSVQADVYDVDAVDTSAAQVASLHQQGRRVICYISAGSWENWRPDAAAFPSAVLGRDLDGWAGERWLDVRRQDVLGPLMAARMDACAAKGFDAVEADNVDGYANRSGFALTADAQLSYNTMLANLAHARGLGIALKNDVDQVVALQPAFDFAINEECFRYRECGAYAAFTSAGKAVLHVEYDEPTSQFCPVTVGLHFSSMRKHLNLGAWRQACSQP